jgi:hypothetical protein
VGEEGVGEAVNVFVCDVPEGCEEGGAGGWRFS